MDEKPAGKGDPLQIYWYWPHPHRGPSPLALAMLRDGDSLTVQALPSLRGEVFDPVDEYAVVRTLPDPTSPTNSRLARALRKPSIAVQRSVARRQTLRQRFDLAHIEMLAYQTDWLDVPSIARGVPLVSSVHDVRPHRSDWPNRIETAALRRLYRGAGHLIVYHSVLADELIDEFGIDPSLIHTVPHPLDATDRREQFERGDDRPIVLVFGSIRANKGYEVLLEALERHHHELDHLRVIVAGSGDHHLESRLADAVERHPNLECEIGFVPAERKHELFCTADVVALPYTSFHSQSGVLADAYAYRVPVIVSDVGALGSTVRDDETGIVVPPGDVDSFADALSSFTRQANTRHVAAIETAVLRYDYATVGRELRAIYDEVVANPVRLSRRKGARRGVAGLTR